MAVVEAERRLISISEQRPVAAADGEGGG